MNENNTETMGTTPAAGMEQEVQQPETAPQATAEGTEGSEFNQGADGTQAQTENLDSGLGTDGAAASEPPAPFLTVRYNHQNRDLTQEEAINWAQRGIHSEAIMADIEYLAAQGGFTPSQFVKNLITSAENQYLDSLRAQLGENATEETLQKMLTVYRNEQKEKYERSLAANEEAKAEEQKTIEGRLAQQYTALKAAVPNAPEFASLPKSVVEKAADNGDLVREYLLYAEQQRQAAEAAKATAKKQEAATAGSGTAGGDGESDLNNAIMRGIWS